MIQLIVNIIDTEKVTRVTMGQVEPFKGGPLPANGAELDMLQELESAIEAKMKKLGGKKRKVKGDGKGEKK